jgi:hypothetical protein
VVDSFRSWNPMTRASLVLLTLNVAVWGVALNAIGR